MRVTETVYGKTKIYLRIVDECASSDCIVSAQAIDAQGATLPTCITQMDNSEHSDQGTTWAIALAALNVDQKVQLTLCQNGEESEILSIDIPATRPANDGMLHKMLHPSSDQPVEQTPAWAARLDPPFFSPREIVHIERFVVDGDTDIVQGCLRIPLETKSDTEPPLKIEVFDMEGKRIEAGDWVCSRDVIQDSPDYPGKYVRTISFSVPTKRVPKILWTHFSNQSLPSSITVLQQSDIDFLERQYWDFTRNAIADTNYPTWLTRHRSTQYELDWQRAAEFSIQPLFSFVVPLYNTPINFLEDMIDSVLAQTYPKLELILVNASPELAELSARIREYEQTDRRIRQITLEGNRGITENTNAGIAVATGDFLCFMDHDDIIEPDLLYEYVRGINNYPETDLLYCDEDKFEDERFFDPNLKPDWSPDKLLAENYITHLLTVRKNIVDALPAPTSEVDGSQDYHMTFRVSEQARNIYHARRVLYHWRSHSLSVASSVTAKPWAAETAMRAVRMHLERIGVNASVSMHPKHPYRYVIDYELPSPAPLVSIIIPNKDQRLMLERCVYSILEKSTYPNYEIIIVENNSEQQDTFDCYEQLSHDQHIRICAVEVNGFNFSKLINAGEREAKGDYLLLLNNDTKVITPNWIEQLLGPCMREEVAATGAKLYYADGTVQHAGVFVTPIGGVHIGMLLAHDDPGYIERVDVPANYSAVTAACMLVRRAAFAQVGGFDEQLAVSYNDIDFCLKLREAGYFITYVPFAELTHYESASRGDRITKQDKIRITTERGLMIQRWPKHHTFADPFGNPNFEDTPVHFRLRW